VAKQATPMFASQGATPDVFEKATLRARRFGLRIIHFMVLTHSIELICEFKKQEELERSFKSLNTSKISGSLRLGTSLRILIVI
jgi:hypothetical protein